MKKNISVQNNRFNMCLILLILSIILMPDSHAQDLNKNNPPLPKQTTSAPQPLNVDIKTLDAFSRFIYQPNILYAFSKSYEKSWKIIQTLLKQEKYQVVTQFLSYLEIDPAYKNWLSEIWLIRMIASYKLGINPQSEFKIMSNYLLANQEFSPEFLSLLEHLNPHEQMLLFKSLLENSQNTPNERALLLSFLSYSQILNYNMEDAKQSLQELSKHDKNFFTIPLLTNLLTSRQQEIANYNKQLHDEQESNQPNADKLAEINTLLDAGNTANAYSQLKTLFETGVLNKKETENALYLLTQLGFQYRDWKNLENILLTANINTDVQNTVLYDLYLESNQIDKAKPYLDKVLSTLDSENSPPYFKDLGRAMLTADFLNRQGNFVKANALINDLKSRYPDASKEYNLVDELWAMSLAKSGKHTDAINLYQTLIEDAQKKNIDTSYYKFAQADIAANMGDINLAQERYLELIKNDPENPNYLNNLGYVLASQTNRLDEAYYYLDQAYKINPNGVVSDSLGWLQYRRGDTDSALNYLSHAYATERNPEIVSHYAEVLAASGRRDQAKEILLEANRREPKNPLILSQMQSQGIYPER